MTNSFLSNRAFIGFERLQELANVFSHANDTYPPHNILKVDQYDYKVEMAIAGFTEDDISIELKDNILTVAGERKTEFGEEAYLHKGISARKFTRSFRLVEYTEVTGATLKDGILGITLSVKTPQEKAPTKIRISK